MRQRVVRSYPSADRHAPTENENCGARGTPPDCWSWGPRWEPRSTWKLLCTSANADPIRPDVCIEAKNTTDGRAAPKDAQNVKEMRDFFQN